MDQTVRNWSQVGTFLSNPVFHLVEIAEILV